jgi:hypothetical protein
MTRNDQVDFTPLTLWNPFLGPLPPLYIFDLIGMISWAIRAQI